MLTGVVCRMICSCCGIRNTFLQSRLLIHVLENKTTEEICVNIKSKGNNKSYVCKLQPVASRREKSHNLPKCRVCITLYIRSPLLLSFTDSLQCIHRSVHFNISWQNFHVQISGSVKSRHFLDYVGKY